MDASRDLASVTAPSTTSYSMPADRSTRNSIRASAGSASDLSRPRLRDGNPTPDTVYTKGDFAIIAGSAGKQTLFRLPSYILHASCKVSVCQGIRNLHDADDLPARLYETPMKLERLEVNSNLTFPTVTTLSGFGWTSSLAKASIVPAPKRSTIWLKR